MTSPLRRLFILALVATLSAIRLGSLQAVPLCFEVRGHMNGTDADFTAGDTFVATFKFESSVAPTAGGDSTTPSQYIAVSTWDLQFARGYRFNRSSSTLAYGIAVGNNTSFGDRYIVTLYGGSSVGTPLPSGRAVDFWQMDLQDSNVAGADMITDGSIQTTPPNLALASGKGGRFLMTNGNQPFLTITSITAVPLAGGTDSSFSGDGIHITPYMDGVTQRAADSRDIALQPDGKIIVVGYANSATSTDFLVERHLTNGTLDSSFGTGGQVRLDFNGGYDIAQDVAVLADGRIAVVGTAQNGAAYEFAVALLSSAGVPDSTFDSDGKISFSIGSGDDEGYSIAVDTATNTLVLGGYAINGTNNDFALARLTLTGAFHTSLNADGKATFDFSSSTDRASSVLIQPDGKIVLGGSMTNGSGNLDVALLRCSNAFVLDSSFGTGGKATLAVGSGDDVASEIALQNDGRIVFAGKFNNGGNQDGLMGRFLANGQVDSTFDGDGVKAYPIGTAADELRSVSLLKDGRIVAVGSTSNGSNDDMAVIRICADGSFDFTFDDDGKVVLAPGSLNDRLIAAAIQADGNIVAAGLSEAAGPLAQPALVRLHSGTVDLLANGGFEANELLGGGQSTTFGDWKRDQASTVATLENGITPYEGTRMLKFLGTSDTGASSATDSDVAQYVDLSAYAQQIELGNVTVEVKARFNRVAGTGTTDTQFGTYIIARHGTVTGGGGLSDNTVILTSDANTATWEEVTNTLTLPPGTTNLFVNLIARENVTNESAGTEFAGHYADDVTLTVTTPQFTPTFASAASIGTTSATPVLTGLSLGTITLGYAPITGTNLTLINNTGRGFITGQFSNLAQGQSVTLSYGGVNYDFVANYYGGTGNDLVLQWKNVRIMAWGYNENGQLGNNGTANALVPAAVLSTGALSGKTVLSVAAGFRHSVALCSDSTVVTWGRNEYGQLGNGSTTNSLVPVAVNASAGSALSGKTVVAVAAGSHHCAALCSDGTVAAWGYNINGQLGNNSTVNSSLPVAVTTSGVLSGKVVVAVVAGGSHNLALCSDGTLAAWGNNSYGHLGIGSGTSSSVPVAVNTGGVLSGKSVVAVAAGTDHSLALCSDGTVAAWGANHSGEIGNNSSGNSLWPSAVYTGGLLSGKAVSAISGGGPHSLALCSDGTLAAWGSNIVGQLGNNSTSNSSVPVAVTTSGVLTGKTVITLASGIYHSLVLCSDGTLAACGSNEFGQLGNNSTVDSLVPIAVSSSTLVAGERFVQIAGGPVARHTLALAAASPAPTVATLAASGVAPVGATLNGTVSANGNSSTVTFDYGTTTAYGLSVAATPSLVTGSSATAVSAALGGLASNTTYHFRAKAVSAGGTSYGANQTFTTSFGDLSTSFASASSVGATSARPILTGGTATLALGHAPTPGASLTLINNTGLTFITGQFSNLAHGQAVTLSYGGVNYDFVANYYGGTGNDLVLVWKSVSAWGWGWNTEGQVGDGTTTAAPLYGKPLPVKVNTSGPLANKTIFTLAGGQNHSLALCSDGTLAAWGFNAVGQLGNGSTTSSSVPVTVNPAGALAGKTVVAISGGGFFNLALCFDGTVVGWGSNSNGQLGNGSTTGISPPVAASTSGVLSGKTVIAVSAGYAHSLVLCSDGSMAAWGYNTYGQLGNNSTTDSSVPVAVNTAGVLNGKTVVAISAGYQHNLALCSDGTLVAWGYNQYGRLGNNSTTNSSVPVAVNTAGVLAGKTVVSIAAGNGHSLALCSDGTMIAWGLNAVGQLGNSSTTNSSVPVAVNTAGVLAGKTVVSIAAGGNHSMVSCSDGTLAAWGSNDGGQLGNNSTTNSSVPVAVHTSPIGAGERFTRGAAGSPASHTLGLVAAPPAPTVTTLAASNRTNSGATLHGTVNANTGSANVTFDYGTTIAYGLSIAATPSPVTGASATAVSAVLSGLDPATTYHFRVRASGAGGVTTGENFSFTTTGEQDIQIEPQVGITLVDGVSTVNFGDTALGTPVSRSFTLTNTGVLPLNVTGLTLPSGYEHVGTFSPFTLSGGATHNLSIRFLANSVPGTFAGTMTVTSNDPDAEGTFTIPLTGRAVSGGDTQLLINGNFETGNFYGWSPSFTPAYVSPTEGGEPFLDLLGAVPDPSPTKGWYVFNGSSGGFFPPLTAIQGYSAWTPFDGATHGTVDAEPLRFFLRQGINLPAGFTGGHLTFSYSFRCDSSGTPRTFTARLLNAAQAEVAVFYEFELPFEHGSNDATEVDLDVSAQLALLPPGSYTFEFECHVPEDYGGPTVFNIDNVSLTGSVAHTMPTVATGSSDNIGVSSATVLGSVNPNGVITQARFEYGLTTAYGLTSSSQPLGSGTSSLPVSANLSGLMPGTVYHYRMVGQNGAATAYGTDGTFSTLSNNADLGDLALSVGILSPAFDGVATAYAVTVPHSQSSILITPATADGHATVAMNGGTLASGAGSLIELGVGVNTIRVVVTAQGGAQKVYTLTVTREGLALGGTPHALIHAIPAPFGGGAQPGAMLGRSVAASADYVAAGAPNDDTGGDGAGVVKVFSASTGAILHVLVNPDARLGGGFGTSVAISGSLLAVGAPGQFSGAYRSGAVYVYDLASATPALPLMRIGNPAALPDENFGHSVAISGSRLLVGTPFDDTGASEAGMAYVFDLSGGTPENPVVTLKNPAPGAGDFFGGSVGIAGTRVVIGAYGDSTKAQYAGTAYVYELSGATPATPALVLHNPSPAVRDYFGTSVAISGSRVVVGAEGDSTAAAAAGSAYVYDLAGGSPATPVTTLTNPSPAVNDWFGHAVGIHGSRVVVGAYRDDGPGTDAGRAYAYDVAGGTPSVPVTVLDNPQSSGGVDFASAVAIHGLQIFIGSPRDDAQAEDAGSVYAYDLGGSLPAAPVAVLNAPSSPSMDNFASAMAVSGSLMVVGAPHEDTGAIQAGSVSVYNLASATPAQAIATIHNPDPGVGGFEFFGTSVAISGTRIVVGTPADDTGASNAGCAYVYDVSGASPVLLATLLNPSPASNAQFGHSVAISSTRVLVGVRNAGVVHVYDLVSDTPSQPVQSLTAPQAGDGFGTSVALAGTLAVIGAEGADAEANNSGRAYVYDLGLASPLSPVAVLINPSPASQDFFGASLAISGRRVVVGSMNDDTMATDAGSAYVFDLGSADPTTPVATLYSPAPAANDSFGRSVAIAGTRVVVGVPFADAIEELTGAAYVFDLGSATPAVPVAALHSPAPSRDDWFGWPVAADGGIVAVAAPNDDSTVAFGGAAYVFGEGSGVPGTVGFGAPVYSAGQDDGRVNVTLVRTGSPAPTTVTLQTNDGTASSVPPFSAAVSGTDYVDLIQPGTTVSFAQGEMSKSVSIALLPKAGASVPNRRLTATLSGPVNGVSLSPISEATIRILANDTLKPTLLVSFPAATATSVSDLSPLVFRGTAGDAKGIDRVEIDIDGSGPVLATLGSATLNTSVPWSFTTSLTDGPHTAIVTAYDLRGNFTSATRSFTYTQRHTLTVSRSVPGGLEATPDLVGTVLMAATPTTGASALSPTAANTDPKTSKAVPGTVIKLTANAKTGYAFSHWDGLPSGATVSGNIMSFPMPMGDEIVTAVFSPNPFTADGGSSTSFYGLVRGANNVESEGFLTAALTATGGLSGKLLIGGLSHTFSGTVYGDGRVLLKDGTTLVSSLPLGSRSLMLQYVGSTGNNEFLNPDHFRVTVSGPVGSATGFAMRATYSSANLVEATYSSLINTPATNPATSKGILTVGFPSKAQTPAKPASQYPQGDGFATVTLNNNGTIMVGGTLADGSTFSASGALVGNTCDLFAQLTTPGAPVAVKGGAFLGTLTFDPLAADSDVSGTNLSWYRPAVTELSGTTVSALATQIYTDGWPDGICVDAVGAMYDKSLDVQTALSLGGTGPTGNGRLTLTQGKLFGLTEMTNFNIAPGATAGSNAVTKIPTTDASFTLTLIQSTGGVTGSFTPIWTSPLVAATAKPGIKAILIQKGENKGAFGFFISNAVGDTDQESGGATLSAPAVNHLNPAYMRIEGGDYQRGDALDDPGSTPVHTVSVSSFSIQETETSKGQWDEVLTWALVNGYSDLPAGTADSAAKPVQGVSWYDVVKWCNARSEKEGLTPCYYTDDAHGAVYRTGEVMLTNAMVDWAASGHRLPTEAEWEKAARGGLAGRRFPWGNTIRHIFANYYSDRAYSYDVNPTVGYHPVHPGPQVPPSWYSSPVGLFASNGYGLKDMAGNVHEWCWDRFSYASTYYPIGLVDPRGMDIESGVFRVIRDGSGSVSSIAARCANRGALTADSGGIPDLGFRTARTTP